HTPGGAAALSSYPDDDRGGAAGSAAADAGQRHGLGTAPSARHSHCRRVAGQPTADLVHHARHLHRFRSARRRVSHLAHGRRAMNFSEVFIRRPIATTLLTMGLALAGIVAYFLLPV